VAETRRVDDRGEAGKVEAGGCEIAGDERRDADWQRDFAADAASDGEAGGGQGTRDCATNIAGGARTKNPEWKSRWWLGAQVNCLTVIWNPPPAAMARLAA